MANGSVYDKIIALGEEDAFKIKQEGEEKAKNITEQIMAEVKEKIEQMIEEAKLKNEDAVKTKLAELEQNKKQEVLASQKKIIKDVFNVVLDKLCNMNDDDLNSFVVSYLKKSELKEDVVIKVSKNEYERYIKLFSKEKSNNLDKLTSSFGHNVVLSNDVLSIKGGFIIEGSYFDIDNSYEVILDNLSSSLETKVAEMLFRSEE